MCAWGLPDGSPHLHSDQRSFAREIRACTFAAAVRPPAFAGALLASTLAGALRASRVLPLPHPLRHDPFLAGPYRRTAVQGERIELPQAIQVAKVHRATLSTRNRQTRLRENRFPAVRHIVEIDDEGRHPLAAAYRMHSAAWLIRRKKVEVRAVFAARVVVEDLQALAVLDRPVHQ